MAGTYKVRIKTDRFELEVESSEKEFVTRSIEEQLRLLVDSKGKEETISSRTSSGAAQVRSAGEKGISIQEFLNQVQPTSGPEFVMAIGYYLEKHQGLPSFHSSQIKSEFQRAKFQHPNPSDAILKARAAGKVMDGPERGAYLLTRTGEQWVQTRLAAREQ